MMDLLKKSIAFALALVLCLSLAACGGDNDVVVGNDWRVTGIVRGSGTIIRDGEGSVDVLVTVDDNGAAFYRDEPEQLLFDSVSFPMTIPGAQEDFADISFADINGDGQSDVYISLVSDSGGSTRLVWLWDPECDRFVYQPEEAQLGAADDGRGDIIPGEG